MNFNSDFVALEKKNKAFIERIITISNNMIRYEEFRDKYDERT